MTGERAARFVLAPIVDGAAAWGVGTDLVLTPIRLSSAIAVVRPARPSSSGGAR